MNEYSEIENKLKQSNLEVDNLLNELVNIRLICLYNNKVLVRENILPNINLQKSLLANDVIIESVNTALNLTLDSINPIPFEYYNDYQKRYYVVNISQEHLLTLSDLYNNNEQIKKLLDIESINDEIDKKVLYMYKKNNLS